MTRASTFRIAVRKFPAFERAIAAQWAAFESQTQTGLTLEAIPMDLHPLDQSLFAEGGMKNGAWDVCFIATDWIAAMHAAGCTLDLASHIAQEDAWPDSLLRLQRIGRSILGMPYHDGPECLIYRRDLFESPAHQARYEALHGKPLAPPKTWQDFHQIARFFNDLSSDLYGTVFAAYPDGHNSVYDFLLQLWTRGGELSTPDGAVSFSTPQAIEALTFYREILSDTTAAHPRCREFDSVRAGLAFTRGEAAMMVNWFGFAAMAHTDTDSKVRGLVEIADIPGNPSISLNVYWILSIAAGSPHPAIALRFLEHCSTAEMDKLTSTSGAIGCRKSTWHDPDVNAAIPFYHRMESLHRVAREIPQRSDWPRIAAVIDRLVVAAITTSTPIETLLAEAERSFATETA